MMVGISKEHVLEWYKGLNAPHRVEIICALLDHSLPFELRFLGSVIENLGRKDFHVLRDAESKANSIHKADGGNSLPSILKWLNEGPNSSCTPVNSVNPLTHQSAPSNHSTSSTAGETCVNATRSQGDKRVDKSKEVPPVLENGFQPSSIKHLAGQSDVVSESDKVNDVANNVDVSSEEELDRTKNEIWLFDGTKRQKVILYLSLLSATNHDSANSYYTLMSEIENYLESLDWFEDLGDKIQDEVLLLYTIGCRHPAFNFEQRNFLASVLNRLKDNIEKDCNPESQAQIVSPVHQYINPACCFFAPTFLHTVNTVSQQGSSPESSPLESPPHSLTHSRSQSPRTVAIRTSTVLSSTAPQQGGSTSSNTQSSQIQSSQKNDCVVTTVVQHSNALNPPYLQYGQHHVGVVHNGPTQSLPAYQPVAPFGFRSTNQHVNYRSPYFLCSQSSQSAILPVSHQGSSPESSCLESPPQSLPQSRSQSPRSYNIRTSTVMSSTTSHQCISSSSNTQSSQMQSSHKNEGVVSSMVPHSIPVSLSIYPGPVTVPNGQGHGNFPYPSVVTYGSMPASTGFRPNGQGPLLNRPAMYMPPNPGIIPNQNPLNVKQESRSNVNMRQKTNALAQTQNTPVKRRGTVNSPSNNSLQSLGNNNNNCGSNAISTTQGLKREDVNEGKDRVVVVSANPNSAKQQTNQSQERNKTYLHQNSTYSNGPVDRLTAVTSTLINAAPSVATASAGNIASNSGASNHNTQHKFDEGQAESSAEFPVFHTGASIYGHPSPWPAPIGFHQNGFIPPSFYSTPLNNPGNHHPHCPPSEMLMSSGPQQYPFSIPFTIPHPQFSNPNIPNLTIKSFGTGNAPKDVSKTQFPPGQAITGCGDSKIQVVNENIVQFGRSNTTQNSVGESTGVSVPAQSPLSNPSRQRGFAGETILPTQDIASINLMDNAVMPPLEDPVEFINRPRKISCWNCGGNTHVGPECKHPSMEEITKKHYQINYGGSEKKDGDS